MTKEFKLVPVDKVPSSRFRGLAGEILKEFLEKDLEKCKIEFDGIEIRKLAVRLTAYLYYHPELKKKIRVIQRGDTIYLERRDKS